jgi:exosome complex component RRP41
MQFTLQEALASVIHMHLYPHSTIYISLVVLAQDGGLLAALINASTLALIDAGIPLSDYLVACTAGSTVSQSSSKAPLPRGLSAASLSNDVDDPLLDLNALEEQELPFLTVATLGSEGDQVAVCVMETRMHAGRLEEMLAVGISGCKSVRKLLDAVVRKHGRKMLEDT